VLRQGIMRTSITDTCYVNYKYLSTLISKPISVEKNECRNVSTKYLLHDMYFIFILYSYSYYIIFYIFTLLALEHFRSILDKTYYFILYTINVFLLIIVP